MVSIVAYVWGIFVALQLFFWAVIFMRLAFYRPKSRGDGSSPEAVTIVVCARNEAQNLEKNLGSLLEQEYPVFELIVVDDASTDRTKELLETYQIKYSKLKVVQLKNKQSAGKKAALIAGIQAAQYDWLLLTDADCRANSKHWIQKMQARVEQKTDVVLGYGPYLKGTGWINIWVRFETLYTAVQYFSFALWGMPYMGVGRNLMYRKTLWKKRRKAIKGNHLASGDDDLWINQMANAENTKICIDAEAFMYSEPKRRFSSVYRQKARHYSTSNYYQLKHQLALGLLALSHFACYVLAFFLLICANGFHYIFLLLMGLRLLLVYVVWYGLAGRLDGRDLLKYLWALDLFVPIYYLLFLPSLILTKKMTWK